MGTSNLAMRGEGMRTFYSLYPDYEPEWEYYFTKLGDDDAVITVDLNLAEPAPIKEIPMCISIKLAGKKILSGGDNIEVEALDKLQREITQGLHDKYGAIKAGQVTFDGQQDLIYYLRKADDLDKTLDDIMSNEERQYHLSVEIDADWDTYFNILCPDEYERQQIKTRNRIELLQRMGDDITKTRFVQFLASFKEDEDKNRYEEMLGFLPEELGLQDFKFTVSDAKEVKEFRKAKYEKSLVFESEMNLNFGILVAVGTMLMDMADETYGSFDGWYAPLVE